MGKAQRTRRKRSVGLDGYVTLFLYPSYICIRLFVGWVKERSDVPNNEAKKDPHDAGLVDFCSLPVNQQSTVRVAG